jgi:hypothetical protein
MIKMPITTTKQQKHIKEIERLIGGTENGDYVYYIGNGWNNCYSIITDTTYLSTIDLQRKYNIDQINKCDNGKLEIFVSRKPIR